MGRPANSIAFVAAVLVACGAGSSAQPKPKDAAAARKIVKELVDPPAINAPLARRVEAMLADLSSNNWKTREDATDGLLQTGAAAESLVRKALDSSDAEVRSRAELVLAAYRSARKDRSIVLYDAVRVLAAAKDKWVIDALVKLLNHDDIDVRYACEYALRHVTGECFTYNAYAGRADREAAAEKWRAWWKKNRDRFAFARAPDADKDIAVLACDSTRKQVLLISLDGKAKTLIQLTGRPYCATGLPNGNILLAQYADNQSKIEEYDRSGKLIWSLKGVPLPGSVRDVRRLPNGNLLVGNLNSQQGAAEVDPKTKKIVWQYRIMTSSAQRLGNGHTLIATYCRGRVFEVAKSGRIVWEAPRLPAPKEATKLPNGNVLVVEYSQRVVELNRAGEVVWQWESPKGRAMSAQRLADGRTVIADRREGLIIVDKAGKARQLHDVTIYGKIRLVPAKP